MRLAHLALLFFCISLPMYFMGLQSPIMQLANSQGNQLMSPSSIVTIIANNMINLAFLAIVAGIALALSAITGFSAIYIIPMLILYAVFQFVLIPSSSIFGVACASPDECMIQLAGTAFLNIILILAFIEFIVGR